MSDYQLLIAKWPELGAPAVSDADVAEAKRLKDRPLPVEPTVPHWTDRGAQWINGEVEPSEIARARQGDARQHHEFQRKMHVHRHAWVQIFNRPEIKAKLEKLNETPMKPAGKVATGRFIVAGVDPQGRQILEPEMAESDAMVPSGDPPWWQANGFGSSISPSDLEAVYVKHGVMLV